MQTRRHFLRSAGTSLAGSVIALSFPFPGRASAKSEQPNYIIIDLDISGISKSRFAENLQDKVPRAEVLESAGYDVAYIEKQHFCREPFYPENQCATLNLASVKKVGFAGDFSSLSNFNSPKSLGHNDQINFDAEKYISLNRDNPFCLFWKHVAVHSSKYLNEDRNRLDESRNQNIISDLKTSVNSAVGKVMNKLDELDITEKTTVFFLGQWQT